MTLPILPSDLDFIAAHSISAGLFARILRDARSPAASETLTEIPTEYGIDRAIALAFFRHESTYGTAGVARSTLGWGNLRPAAWQNRRIGVYISPVSGSFAKYATWADSLHEWCYLIKTHYVMRGLTTVRTALPIYAPSSDGNSPRRYADQVIADVARWRVEDMTDNRPRWRVKSVANLRKAAAMQGPVLGQLAPNTEWRGWSVRGQSVRGNNLWVSDGAGRYVWAGNLEAI